MTFATLIDGVPARGDRVVGVSERGRSVVAGVSEWGDASDQGRRGVVGVLEWSGDFERGWRGGSQRGAMVGVSEWGDASERNEDCSGKVRSLERVI